MPIKSALTSKTVWAAAGLAGLALYQLTTGDYVTAFQTGMAALAALGLRQAVERVTPRT